MVKNTKRTLLRPRLGGPAPNMEVLVLCFSWRVSWMLFCAAPCCGVFWLLRHPRVRGADRTLEVLGRQVHGVIPVHMGANAPGESAIFFYFGSSPYIWGKRSACCSIRNLFRFIPVCTGQMWGPVFLCKRVKVHPRIHGADI